MYLRDIFAQQSPAFSFKFFPSKTDAGLNDLFETMQRLKALEPSFVSITYGAGGSTRERTRDLVVRIYRELKLTAVSHLTCICHSQQELESILEKVLVVSGVDRRSALKIRQSPVQER